MLVLILFQYIAPVAAAAEVLAQKTAALTLVKAEKGQSENQVALSVKIDGGEQEETLAIQSSENIFSMACFDEDKNVNDVTLDTQGQIHIKAAPGETDTRTILLTIKDDTALKANTISFGYNEQSLSYQLPDKYLAVNDHTKQTNDVLTETDDSELAASNQTEPASASEEASSSESMSESTISSDEMKDEADQSDKTAVVHSATDIRTYFPDAQGTILTDSSLTYKDENGTIVQAPLTEKTSVQLFYAWRIPEEIREQIVSGDYFAFQLPDQLKPNRALNGHLQNDAGEVYATYTVDSDGHVVFTFNDHVTKESHITGTFHFDTHFDTVHIDKPGHTTIAFPEEDQLPPVDVFIRPDTDKEIDKQGHFDRTPNPTEIEWTIDMNHAMNQLTNPTVSESWPKGIDYQSVKVYELVMNLDGTIKEQGRLLEPSEYRVDQNGNVTVDGETQKAYRLVYQTSINQSIVPDNGGKVPFVNTAKLTDENDKDGIDAKATVTANYGKLLTKEKAGYDAANQQFSWRIKYNYGEKAIAQADAHLVDTMSQNLDFDAASLVVRPVSFSRKGTEHLGAPLVSGTDYQIVPAEANHGFTLQFLHDVNQAYQIDYKTDVNQIVEGTSEVDNHVAVDDKGGSSSHGQAEQQNVIKNLGTVDYANQTVDWSIAVNKNHYLMKNLVLQDTYSPAHGLRMALRQGAQYDLDILDKSANNKKLEPDKDYTIALFVDKDGYQTGFRINMIGNYAATDHEFTIDYRTNFDTSNLEPDQPTLDHFTNGISVDWIGEEGDNHHSEDHKDFKPHYSYALNAQKGGVYNAVTKTITWTIAVNLSANQLNEASLVDQIKDNQSYVAGSLQVFEGRTNPDGSVTKRTPNAVNMQMRKMTEPSVLNDQNVEVDFPNGIAKTYIIEFQTSVADKVIEEQGDYTNVARYENNGDKRDVTGEVSVKYGGKLVEKSGEQDTSNPDYVNWQLLINPSQSTLSNVVIEDTPSANQVIDQSSIHLYETNVASDGTITPNMDASLTQGTDYTVEVKTDNETGQQAMTIKLTNEIETSYYMTYRSFITSSIAGNTDKVSNTAKITGDNVQTVIDDSGTDVTVEVDHSSGNATGEKGRLILQKTDSDGKTPLAGAHFELWDSKKSQLLREGEVNSFGQITFGALPFGNYLLFETNAPDGYSVSDELAKGKRVTISAENTGDDVSTLALKNERNEVILHKVDASGNPITSDQDHQFGAQFKIERLNILSVTGNNWDVVDIDPNTTNQKGDLIIKSLPVGIYRATEITAPTDYILDQTPSYFIVAKTANGQIPIVEVTITNYQGAAELTKTTESGQPLAGAEFDVVNEKGEAVNEQALISDDGGIVRATGLAPGSYYFKETKAPKGYLVNSTQVPFEIAAKQTGEPDTVTVQPDGSTPLSVIDYLGSASIKKTDEAGNSLAGAEFDVLDEEGQVVNSRKLVSQSDGSVSIDQLSPGKYSFVERKAPDGYLLNTKPVDFTIDDQAAGKPDEIIGESLKNYKGSFSIRKTDSAGTGLQGAEFTLYDNNKQRLDLTETANSEGFVTFKGLAPGIYYYQEIKAPQASDGTEYIINPSLIKVEIPDAYQGKPEVFDQGDFQNFRGEVKITKKGEGGSIAGTTFDLYRITDGKQDRVSETVVGDDGVLDLSNLGVGSYKLVEAKAAPGYVINTQPIYFLVNPENDENEMIDHIDFTNYQSEMTGRKLNEDREGLANAEYQIYAVDAKKNLEGEPIHFATKEMPDTDKIITNAKGEIYAKGLEKGTYALVETKAPTGYILDKTKHLFTITDQIGKPKPIDIGDLMDYQGSVTLRKTTSDHAPLPHASFDLLDENNQVVNTNPLITDAQGQITVTDLAPGTYHFEETKAPEGYLINTETVTFTIKASQFGEPDVIKLADFIDYKGSAVLKKTDSDGNGLSDATFNILDSQNQIVNATPLTSNDNGEVQITDLSPGDYRFVETKAPAGYILNNEPVAFTIENTAKGEPATVQAGTLINYQGSAELIKTDEAGHVLSNAVFTVFHADGNEVTTTTSDQNGHVYVSGLAPGDYQLKETKAPDGYVLNDRPVSFTVALEASGKPETLTLGEFINFKGSAKLMKIAENGTPLTNVTFDVLDDQDNQVNDRSLVTNENGEVEMTDLAPGNYHFVENTTSSAYILNTETVSFTVPDHASEKPVLSVGTFINYQGSAVLKKTTEDGRPLRNAAFAVLDEQGNKLTVDDLITDADGLIKIDHLAPGNYAFVEVAAPTGYLLNMTAVPFTINETELGEPEPIFAGTLIDYQGSATLTKTNADDEPLADAVFKVVDSEGTIVAENLLSDEDGIVHVEGLAPGSYSFVETQAPIGYRLDDASTKFVIESQALGAPDDVDAGSFVNQLIPNKPDTSDRLPKTNDQGNMWLSLIGGLVVILAASAGGYVNRKRKR